jgi:hypothetical protein
MASFSAGRLRIAAVKSGNWHLAASSFLRMSARAVAILRQLESSRRAISFFAGQARNKPLSNMAVEMVLRRMKIDDGFRSSFRDWAGNVSNFPREITETALAHVIGDKAEQAYPLEQRAEA